MNSPATLAPVTPHFEPHFWDQDIEGMFEAAVRGHSYDFDELVRRSSHFDGGDQLRFTAHGGVATAEGLWLANVQMARLGARARKQFRIPNLLAEPYGTTYGVQVPAGNETIWVIYVNRHFYVAHAENIPTSNPVPCRLIPVGSRLDIRMHGGFHD